MKVKPPISKGKVPQRAPRVPCQAGQLCRSCFSWRAPGCPGPAPQWDRAQHSLQPQEWCQAGLPRADPTWVCHTGMSLLQQRAVLQVPSTHMGVAIISTGTAGSPHPACALEIPRCSSKISLKRRANKKPGTQPHLPEHGEADGLIQGLVPKENQN